MFGSSRNRFKSCWAQVRRRMGAAREMVGSRLSEDAGNEKVV